MMMMVKLNEKKTLFGLFFLFKRIVLNSKKLFSTMRNESQKNK